MTENLINEFNLLRTILQSDDQLQIQSSENYHQVYLKFNFNIRISFFIDRLNTSIKTLTINNIDDLHISKLSNKNSLKHEQWIYIQNYFNELIQQSNSNTSIYSIIQLIQEKLLEFSNSSPENRIVHHPTIDHEECSTNTQLKSTLIQGLYHYDQSIHQWILCTDIQSLTSDDLTIPSIDLMCIPERCQFVTWNILSSETIYFNERYKEILKTLKSLLADIICLQDVTKDFLSLLLNENWLKENNYYILNNIHQEIISGQLILMKNFRPRAFILSEYFIARFGLNSNVTIDLINLHLHKTNEKSSQELEELLKKINRNNYIIIGDLNFGDYDIIQENIIQKYHYHIHDLWKDIYDIEENPGYTFDPSRNICAKITSNSQISLRTDRYLLHKLPNLCYSIEHLNIIGHETILIDSINNQYINQSDHYALQLIIHFRIRSINHHSALVILPTNNLFSSIESFPNQCSTYINLFYPFFNLKNCEDDEENILLSLRLLLTQFQPFNIEINSSINEYIKQLYKQIKELFPQCGFDNNHSPYLIDKNHIKSIHYLYILQQENNTRPFSITYQLPLGSVLQPISLNSCDYISNDLIEFFKQMNLYSNEKIFQEKQEKFYRLLNYFNEIFNENTLHCFSYTFHPYGSFRLGLDGDDLDTVFVLTETKLVNNPTNLDKKFLQLKSDILALNNYIIDLLEKQIIKDLYNEIIDCRNIQALYPIISIIFNNQIRVEIFVQIILNNQDEINTIFYEPIHGVHDIERLITYVRFPPIFQYLLTFIRTWAQNVGLYGQVYGYLGGYSWAVLCAYICHKYISSIQSNFTLEEFLILVKNFFSIYSQLNWSYESICLYSHHSTLDYYGSMRILCPNFPYNNTSRSTINSTRYLIIQAFQNTNNKTLENILQLSNQFPDQTIQSILQLKLSCQTMIELNQWIGYMKSRLAHFFLDCENECNLFIQPDTKIEIRTHLLERFYSMGFQLNEQILSYHREFYYSLNRFLEQFQICSFRNETMKISYKLMSIKDWYNERNKHYI